MSQKNGQGLWSERKAARYLGIRQETLREYVRKKIIPVACRVERRVGANCLVWTYRFEKEALDAYDQRRRDGCARRGNRDGKFLSQSAPRRAENLAGVRHAFEYTDLSLRKIATGRGVSHTAIWLAGREIGYDFAARNERIRKEQERARQFARFEKPFRARLEIIPQWYLALVHGCRDRGIRFEPAFIRLKNGSKIDFHRARLDRRRTRVRFAGRVWACPDGIARYAMVRGTHVILDVETLLAVAAVDGEFHFWRIPGAVANKRTNISLSVDREVRVPFGQGMIDSSSQWWQYYGGRLSPP